ncbi:hypothetical protein ACUHGC_08630 [Testudinibacter sp. P27/CKL/0425]
MMMSKTGYLVVATALLGLSACSSKPPMQTGSIYPNPHLTPPTSPVPRRRNKKCAMPVITGRK